MFGDATKEDQSPLCRPAHTIRNTACAFLKSTGELSTRSDRATCSSRTSSTSGRISGTFDYVLIDSRTGHTDIGGICTRQLPDAVVAMFQPTEQNIVGLTKVIQAIRLESQEPTGKAIDLHFVMSNVQDLDDEDLILKNRIEHAKDSLQCADDFLTLHHYSSLALLDQSVFVLDHPRSRLTTEYKRLVEQIRSKNLEDRDGALAYVGGSWCWCVCVWCCCGGRPFFFPFFVVAYAKARGRNSGCHAQRHKPVPQHGASVRHRTHSRQSRDMKLSFPVRSKSRWPLPA